MRRVRGGSAREFDGGFFAAPEPHVCVPHLEGKVVDETGGQGRVSESP